MLKPTSQKNKNSNYEATEKKKPKMAITENSEMSESTFGTKNN